MDLWGSLFRRRAAARSLTSHLSAPGRRLTGAERPRGSNPDTGHPTAILSLRRECGLTLVIRSSCPLPHPVPTPGWPGSHLLSQPRQSPYLHPPVSFLLPLGSPKTAPPSPSSHGCLGTAWLSPWQGSEEGNPHPGQTRMESAGATGVGRPDPKPPPLHGLSDKALCRVPALRGPITCWGRGYFHDIGLGSPNPFPPSIAGLFSESLGR